MRSQGVVEEVEHVDRHLGVGDCQPRLDIVSGGEALLELFKETSASGPAITKTTLVLGRVE